MVLTTIFSSLDCSAKVEASLTCYLGTLQEARLRGANGRGVENVSTGSLCLGTILPGAVALPLPPCESRCALPVGQWRAWVSPWGPTCLDRKEGKGADADGGLPGGE